MAKTHNNLYEKIISFDNLLEAYKECRKGKRYSVHTLKFNENLEQNLIDIHTSLINKTWKPGKAHRFIVREPKIRQITAPPFSDRVVHHAIMRICAPLFEQRFISNSFACRKGKGSQAAVNKLQQYMRIPSVTYAIKADVKKCFDSLDHTQLMKSISKVISCRDTLNLFESIFNAYGYVEIGIPIGALSSQWICNLLLNDLDHAMMDKHGFGKYIRYMDDVIILAEDKETARHCLSLFEEELNNLGLKLNPKSCISPINRGIDFVGYRTFSTHILPRKRVITKFLKLLLKGKINIQHINSFLAYAKHCNSFNTISYIFNPIGNNQWKF